MSIAVPTTTTSRPRWRIALDVPTAVIWVLCAGLVLYLAFNDGGYALVAYGQTGIVVWWVVLVGALLGLLPAVRLTRSGRVALILFGGFAVWTALATIWSISSERSLQEVARVVAYLGVLVLALSVYGDRRRAMRHAVSAVAASIVLVAILALLSRTRPESFPAAQRALAAIGGADGRLSWPLNYWNGLAALMAIGIPLLLATATSARTLAARAVAAGAIPVVALVAYLTFSRGGAIEIAVGLIVFVALAPERIPRLLTMAVCAAGSAALIAGAHHRNAIEHGLTSAAAQHQGTSLLVAVILVCVGVGLVQTAIGLAVRHGVTPRWLRVPARTAAVLLAVAVLGGIAVGIAAHGPAHLSHLWSDFKRGSVQSAGGSARFANTSGEGRYTYWKVAVQASSGHVLTGAGPGTFQLLWLPRAPFEDYVQNAHSLYVETYAEVGLVGLLLLLGFFGTVVTAAVRRLAATDPDTRTRAAGIAAACAAFLVAAAVDWVWEMPVLPVAILLLGASVLAPAGAQTPAAPRPAGRLAARLLAGVVALAGLLAIGIPLATAGAVSRSQAAEAAGQTSTALADARTAIRLEPGAASPELQLALILERRRSFGPAVAAAQRATRDEPANWETWLVLSRLQVEAGDPHAAILAYRRARADNPRSPIFAS